MHTHKKTAWDIVADIGGTNARFAIYIDKALQQIISYATADYESFAHVLHTYLYDIERTSQWEDHPRNVCLAVACPYDPDHVHEVISFTNSPWSFTQADVHAILKESRIIIINDFVAIGYSLMEINDRERCQIGGTKAKENKPIAFLGPGTGLGVGYMLPLHDQLYVLDTEGGHIDYSPNNANEVVILEFLSQIYGHVSLERILSGNGMINIYRALAHIKGITVSNSILPAGIMIAALKGEDPISIETLHTFCRVLGSACGNIALTIGAKGGVYIAGGIIPQCITFLVRSDFRNRFEGKGRMNNYLTNIPVWVVLRKNLGLFGAAQAIAHVD